MAPNPVVIYFKILEQFPSRFLLCLKTFTEKMSLLERSKERLGRRVVVAVSRARHALDNTVRFQDPADTMVGVLYATVRVKDKSRQYDSSGERHPERVYDGRSTQVVCNGVTHHAARAHVLNRRQVKPTLVGVDVGDVRYPHFVRPVDVEVLFKKVRRSIPVFAPDRRMLEAPYNLRSKPNYTHKSRYSLVVHRVALLSKCLAYSRAPVFTFSFFVDLPYPPDQLFNVGISSGDSSGTILSSNGVDTARYFTNIPEGFKFIAADSKDGDSAVVEITVGLPAEEGVPCAVAPGGKVANNKVAAFQYRFAGSDVRMSLPPNASVMKSLSVGKPSLQAGKKMVSSEVDFTSSEYGVVREMIRKHTIMLGETEYYYAVNDPDHADKLIIKDSHEPMNGNTNVVFADPTIVKGDKSGVYWEYRDEDGNDLKQTKPGSIRLVGRYWEDVKPYKVRLTASAEGRYGSVDIEVKKPRSLGNNHQMANDMKGNPFNLDSLIIYYAGREGVMPQYLKAMVSKETMGYFDPCYRYEAFKDAVELQVKDPKTNDYVYKNLDHSHYRILGANDNGSPDIPSDHSNLRDASCVGTNSGKRINYPGYTTVWDYYWNHTDFYSLNIYSGVKEIENSWENININTARELYGKTPEELVGIEKQATDDSTNARFFRWAKFDYRGGMQNMVAQTRICGSYGILQLMYYGAEEYPKNKEQYRPEDINDYRVGFEYGVKHLIGKFNLQSILGGHFSDPTWNGGLEAKYKQAVKRYNGRGPAAEDYANDVISRVPQYKPKP